MITSIRDLLPQHLGGSLDNIWNRLFAQFAGPYEKDVIDFYTKYAPHNVSVDIGAGTGYHTKRLAKISRRVIAIEPANDLVNMPQNVEVHKVAVGRRHEVKEMKIYERWSVGFSNATLSTDDVYLKTQHGAKVESLKMVDVVPLDDIVTRADFLKIDTEGYEVEILEPSKLIHTVKYAMIELHPVSDLVDYQTRIFKLLKNFRVYALELNSYVTIDDVPLRKRSTKSEMADNHRLFCVRIREDEAEK